MTLKNLIKDLEQEGECFTFAVHMEIEEMLKIIKKAQKKIEKLESLVEHNKINNKII
jgi:hypothetical protein